MADDAAGLPGNTGPGDNFDPEVHGVDDGEFASTGSGASRPADGSGGQGVDEDGTRASEVDDVTAGLDRDDVDAALAAEIDGIDVDFSDVDVAAVLSERDEYKNLAQRVQADFDNFRKQSAIRAQQEADRATGRLAEALLPVLDAAEAAFLNHPAEIEPLLNQMLAELKKHGLETLDLDGQPFDPEVAEAVAHEPGDGGEPIVAEVLRSGYQWKGKTLRAAMVKTKD
ncbi:nucleotide exchange factor GrpE [Ilumatobacter coccineus]|jgi:molecular chaperone GrpE|uniref:Protein GrpE n=1 Tax=Ilumatobacter coccineus (strain NBRC 103263 / KCTC 29153 / YM16-304) TaxID=1313172 RepID=A0A6C7ED36_ILUCY|nr:nucleotide exchange factor GrpE [Ilumatobacter coccineus]BAN04233.1 GrpE protein [Ilumatobacter coccineus YM16-304]